MKSDSVFEWNGHVCVGSRSPLELPRLALLNSAQSKYPLGGDEWILGTEEALQSYSGEGFSLVSSVGLNTWEFVAWAGGGQGYPLILTVIWDGKCDPLAVFKALAGDLDLQKESTTLLLLPTDKRSTKEAGPHRDHFVVSLAHTVVPISIHPGGRMEALLDSTTEKRIDWGFRRDWKQKAQGGPYHFDMAAIEREADPCWEGWLIHWTHSCQGPWPGETRASFFQSVTDNWEEYTHSARRTLERIAGEKRIRSSPWRIRGREGVVCFSGLSPSQATGLMRWRARFVRYSIEPYGLGLRLSAAKQLGIQPVYYLEDDLHPPSGIPAFLLQASGRSGGWPRENEYRHKGDIDLGTLAPEEWEPIVLPILAGPGGTTGH